MIEPFAFKTDLAENMRTRTVCGVSQGDLPLRLTWLKDGDNLLPSLGVNISNLDQYTSILSITSLSQIHSGNYTCVASNQADEVKFTAKLQVKGNVVKSQNPNRTSKKISTYAKFVDISLFIATSIQYIFIKFFANL